MSSGIYPYKIALSYGGGGYLIYYCALSKKSSSFSLRL